jgi:RNA recognition motif-containing protein
VMAFQDVAIMVDRATNKSRGFGFVTFETEEAVEAVMRNKVSRFPSIPLLPLPLV